MVDAGRHGATGIFRGDAPLWSDRQALQEVFIQRKNTLSWANLPTTSAKFPGKTRGQQRAFTGEWNVLVWSS
jgi:hypothetical protein